MTGETLLSILTSQGLSLTLEGEQLRVRPSELLTNQIREIIRAHKPELINVLSWSDQNRIREWWETEEGIDEVSSLFADPASTAAYAGGPRGARTAGTGDVDPLRKLAICPEPPAGRELLTTTSLTWIDGTTTPRGTQARGVRPDDIACPHRRELAREALRRNRTMDDEGQEFVVVWMDGDVRFLRREFLSTGERN